MPSVPFEHSISRTRADTVADEFTIQVDGVADDITGSTFRLTVDTRKAPTDNTTVVFQMVGILTAPASGEVEFAPTPLQAATPIGKYFYDVQRVYPSGRVHTIMRGTYTFTQDITKDLN